VLGVVWEDGRSEELDAVRCKGRGMGLGRIAEDGTAAYV
jgi:hypothetical protein